MSKRPPHQQRPYDGRTVDSYTVLTVAVFLTLLAGSLILNYCGSATVSVVPIVVHLVVK
jgi:hypothetical protein